MLIIKETVLKNFKFVFFGKEVGNVECEIVTIYTKGSKNYIKYILFRNSSFDYTELAFFFTKERIINYRFRQYSFFFNTPL